MGFRMMITLVAQTSAKTREGAAGELYSHRSLRERHLTSRHRLPALRHGCRIRAAHELDPLTSPRLEC